MRKLKRRQSNVLVLDDPDSFTGKAIFIALKNAFIRELKGPEYRKTLIKRKFQSPLTIDTAIGKIRPKVYVHVYYEPSPNDLIKAKNARLRALVSAGSPVVR